MMENVQSNNEYLCLSKGSFDGYKLSLSALHKRHQIHKINDALHQKLDDQSKRREEILKLLRDDIHFMFSNFTEHVQKNKGIPKNEKLFIFALGQLNGAIARFENIYQPKSAINPISLNACFDEAFGRDHIFLSKSIDKISRGDLPMIYDDRDKIMQLFEDLAVYVKLSATPYAQVHFDFKTAKTGNFFELSVTKSDRAQSMQEADATPKSLLYLCDCEIDAIGGRFWNENRLSTTKLCFTFREGAQN